MKEVLDLIREFGLSLVVAVAASYALYKFFFFSIREVKSTFEKRHDLMRDKMEEVKDEVISLKQKIELLIGIINNK
ncbi:MAG: hypothetical protein ACR2M9_00230, partial [Cyanophyceae cyanobacterium]